MTFENENFKLGFRQAEPPDDKDRDHKIIRSRPPEPKPKPLG